MSDLAPYLRRLGYDAPPPPTLATLVQIHGRHLARIPYDNLSIQLGTPDSVDAAECVDRVGRVGRLGYCFHQNTAAEVLLRALGFGVERRHGHVWTGEEPSGDFLNHLVLVVRCPDAPEQPWWFDAGLGDGFAEPLPLAVGEYVDAGGFRYAISDVAHGAAHSAAESWSFRHDASGTFTGVQVTSGGSTEADVAAAHEVLSTSPTSGFVRLLAVLRRDATGVDILRGCLLLRVRSDRTDEREVTTYAEWRAALTDGVGLPAADVDDSALRVLFERTLAGHRAWTAAGRP
jgi:N-hydroxyarylamine O-acetyltransferase